MNRKLLRLLWLDDDRLKKHGRLLGYINIGFGVAFLLVWVLIIIYATKYIDQVNGVSRNVMLPASFLLLSLGIIFLYQGILYFRIGKILNRNELPSDENAVKDASLSPILDVNDNNLRKRGFRGLQKNILTGIRMFAFRSVSVADLSVSAGQFIGLVLVDFIVTFLYDFSRVGTKGYFDYQNIPNQLFYIPLMLAAAYLIARMENDTELSLAVPIALLSVSIPISLISSLINAADKWMMLGGLSKSDIYHGILGGWLIMATYIGLLRITRTHRKVLMGLIIIFILIATVFFMGRTGIWAKKYESDASRESRYAIVKEDAFYAQPEILYEKLKGLKPGRQGIVDLYFVGLAGYSSQDVFLKEIEVINRLFDERFDTVGRSISLINNPKTANLEPIASLTSLDRTLKHVSRIMDPKEDILFLYITSHGSKKHKLSMDYWPLQLKDLDPQSVQKVIADSGIKWKVIVISACYSGGFLDSLKDDDTLVMTASDADHNSFGCSDEADFTFFGKAYFDEELRHSFSFISAFDKAKQTISDREKANSYKPSNPQIYIGPAIRQQLSKLESRLQSL